MGGGGHTSSPTPGSPALELCRERAHLVRSSRMREVDEAMFPLLPMKEESSHEQLVYQDVFCPSSSKK